jgi:PAS domain S-box-containing protein
LLLDSARALAVAGGREVGKAHVMLRVLSTSSVLATGDIALFHDRARRTIEHSSSSISLFTRDGEALMNTALPYGSPLRRSARTDTFRRIADSGKGELSGLYRNATTGRQEIAWEMPVIQEGQVRYILSMGFSVEVFQDILMDLKLPPSWVASVLDQNGVVIARTREQERVVGQRAPGEYLRAVRASHEGLVSMTSLDGDPVLVAHSRVPDLALYTAVGYPEAELAAAVRRSLGWLFGLIAAAAAGLIASLMLARDIARSVGKLLVSATAMGQGRTPGVLRTGLTEVDLVGDALVGASLARQEAESSIRENELRLRLAMEAGELGSWEYDVDLGLLDASASCKAKFGRGPDELFSYGDLVSSIHPEDRKLQQGIVERAIVEKGTFGIEYRVIWPDGSLHWVHIQGAAFERAGKVYLVGTSQDISSRKLAESQQELLLHELNHRVKNTLATVQSVAAMTARSAEDPAEAWKTFDARVRGMAQTHDLLTQSQWTSALLRDILAGELDFYQDTMRQRVFLHGNPVQLAPKATLALGLAVHELATNAAKYGALSVPEGRLSVRWAVVKIDGYPHLLIEWVESNGPPVAPPKRQGFGSRLIHRGLTQELGGDIKLTFEPSGVRCVITFPLQEVDALPGVEGAQVRRQESSGL